MPDVHLFQWVIAFAGALWLTARWLLARPTSRWRHIVGGLMATLLWLPVAYTANNVHVVDQGTREAFGSNALGGVATFMAVACLAGLVIGLFLWVEEAADEASAELPGSLRRGDPRRGDD
jgi:hypothetical protein